jgi:hypothetical protein
MRKAIRFGIAGLLAAGLLMTAPAAFASSGAPAKGGIRVTGKCSASGVWKLKVGKEDGRLEVEFQVDNIKPGQAWDVTLSDNGTTFFSRTKTAKGDAFHVRKLTANQAGTDTIEANATNQVTGETCMGSLNFG